MARASPTAPRLEPIAEGERLAAAKHIAADVVTEDQRVVNQMLKLIEMYREAAVALRQARRAPRAAGVSGYEEFDALADSYERRVRQYTDVAALLGAGRPQP
eukprot:TRINITY_DN70692_c0_g1_i1.p1 TRINITY_DN70692_c0_g1~~TRINITY_DN70692_c0_g1_i1.p1  ORF type:complete len:117 (+),score=15.23 TRINITY_DN70692_c0_g1_i1:46-351(+)